ncbi:putative aminoacyltransferase, E1 ubiquitin-activating enzyme [Medicago truncatula]|uniref:U-box domain-containing protein n=1 Tax=Medicago truncatula TaxID=3880 RepID=A0A072V1M9_MEDTR|nr:U-box domain-containing protein 25 [Medicago truncatula]KEH35601.1 E3 ubiquitin ligase PUB14 [Medicago truncatula]RHN69947.1 putative aminoacyltransferase, E1 ubiquitin-activating enzyme [Medicago truncatula]
MNKAQTEITIPHLFRCPISLDLLEDPVTLTTGQTYDRSSIEKWISADSQLSENHMEFVEIALSCILKLLPIVNLEPLNIIKDESKLERFIFLFEKGTSSIKTSLCLVIDHSTATAQTEEVCEVLGNSQKLVHEIVQVVFNKNYDKVSEAAIKALSALCSLESNKESLVKGGAINGIITYISRCENRQKNLAPLAMATMKKLLVLESGKEALVNHVNGIETLVKMVFKVCNQECSESAVEILSIVCSDFGSAREVAIGAGVLSQLLFLLQSQCGTKTKTKARMLLKLLRSKWNEESMQL